MKNQKLNRRNFLKTVGAASIGSAIASTKVTAETDEKTKAKKETQFPQIPKRPLGKTGVEVPVLSLGGMFQVIQNQTILKTSLKWGVSYWDTADCYMGGNSEIGMGKYIKRHPDVRKNLFLVSKSDQRDPATMQGLLDRSLKRLNTDHIDLYFIHGMGNPDELNDGIKKVIEKNKAEGKIKFFGFSTHSNMEKCLMAASKLDWIDAIMTSYNIHLMHKKEMNDAVQACHDKGIGLIAMKVQGKGQKIKSQAEKKLTDHFLESGFTEGQAKLKAVLEDKRITAACLAMKSVAMITTNVAAVLDKTKLSKTDKNVLQEYALENCNGYCAGCSQICQRLTGTEYLADTMRYLMYYNGYGDKNLAKQLFAEIPAAEKTKLLNADYSVAQARCPQSLPIKKLMAEALQKLA
ncbi:MAG: aldo/keto reductase [Planctomycetes bacterium]|nr:aldo/keto reductase [Planctomycetota bacterium]